MALEKKQIEEKRVNAMKAVQNLEQERQRLLQSVEAVSQEILRQQGAIKLTAQLLAELEPVAANPEPAKPDLKLVDKKDNK